jgi:hypothetical protein
LKSADGSFTPALLLAVGLLVLSLFFVTQMKDPGELSLKPAVTEETKPVKKKK